MAALNIRHVGTHVAQLLAEAFGSLENFSRQEIQAYIKSKGGKTTSSVSRNTDLVLVGENPGSKADKAHKLGLKIVSESQFVKITTVS